MSKTPHAPVIPSASLRALVVSAQKIRPFASNYDVRLTSLESAVKYALREGHEQPVTVDQQIAANLSAASEGFAVGAQALRLIARQVRDGEALGAISPERATEIAREITDAATQVLLGAR